jgi:peptide/nickel transport system substrate-binding protein
MIKTSMRTKIRRRTWGLGVVALIAVLLAACGTAAPPEPVPPAGASGGGAQADPTPTLARPTVLGIQPTPTPAPAQASAQVESAKDMVIMVTSIEPGSLDAWDPQCTADLDSFICNDAANEPFTWITSDTFEVVPLSGVEGWEQLDPDRWRFTLRQGVKFHNGEPWNASSAKAGIDQNGNEANASQSFSYHGAISAEVVDEYTVDVVCQVACPILPRSMIFSRFQAPEWYASTPADERVRKTVSIGPYKVMEWRPGIDVKLEAYEDYVPNESTVDAQAPSIKNVVTVWRTERLVRAAMVDTGEADWAMDIGFENKSNVPKWKQSTTTEVYALIPDLMWHPELKKKKVREALNLAVDCQAITDALLDGIPCWGNISPQGSVGITPENSAPYPYSPERASQLLQEAGYDPNNKIRIYTRPGYCCRDLEFQEAVVNYWKEVGVNAELSIVERRRQKDITSSGCGRLADEAGYEEALDCSSRQPPAPLLDTAHTTVTATSNEMLDHQVQAVRRMGCFSVSSRVCFPELQGKIETAIAAPEGPERIRLMEELGDIAHDDFLFIPFVQVELVYGLAENLEWEPLYAPRVRVNTMRFK